MHWYPWISVWIFTDICMDIYVNVQRVRISIRIYSLCGHSHGYPRGYPCGCPFGYPCKWSKGADLQYDILALWTFTWIPTWISLYRTFNLTSPCLKELSLGIPWFYSFFNGFCVDAYPCRGVSDFKASSCICGHLSSKCSHQEMLALRHMLLAVSPWHWVWI